MSQPKTVATDWLLTTTISLYMGSLVLANLLNVSRLVIVPVPFLNFKLIGPIGLVCYPITFLCTDIICELYGKKMATQLVWVGFWVNLVVCGLLVLANQLPFIPNENDPVQTLTTLTLGCTISSSIAYLITQNIDVWVFHRLKAWTQGKHLWLRNNVSTWLSQAADTLIVVLLVKILTGAYPDLPGENTSNTLLHIMLSMYAFKFTIALLDTLPFYIIVLWTRRNTISPVKNDSCDHTHQNQLRLAQE